MDLAVPRATASSLPFTISNLLSKLAVQV